VRAAAAKASFTNETATTENIAAAADLAAGAITDPMSDVYASSDYRVHLAKVLSRRALAEAAKRAI